MAYITPDTTVYLCKDVPLDSTYEHSIYWDSASAQLTYFKSKIYATLTDYTYQRVQKGVLRCGINAENLYDCNYLLFQNSAYGSRWFYCFINAVEYINNVTSDIYFELDLLQTWFFDYEPSISWIEREHTASDLIGVNRQPEPLQVTEYGCATKWTGMGFNELVYIVAICDTSDTGVADVCIIDHVLSGCDLYIFDQSTSSITAIELLIEEYKEAEDSIVNIYCAPAAGINPNYINTSTDYKSVKEISNLSVISNLSPTQFAAAQISADDGIGWLGTSGTLYTPRNCKLYTYPYNYFCITDANGNSLVLPYEYFDDNYPIWCCKESMNIPVEVCCYPINYKGSFAATSNPYGRFMTESLTLSDYPMCSWSYDAYEAWLAQNSVPLIINAVASLGQSTMQMSTGNLLGTANTLSNTLTSMISQMYSASIQADVCRGSFAGGGANIASEEKDFYYSRMCIDQYTAERFDCFFDFYGYAVNTRGVPQRNNRPYWTYCKTANAQIEGSIPAQDARKICEIYNKGITWWNGEQSDYILDYSQDNRATVRGA